MSPYQATLGTTIQINAKLLYAVILGVAAYFIWPTNPKYWGFGFLSIVMALAAIGLVIEAVRAMVKLYARDKALENYVAQGSKTKSSEMTTNDALEQAGMR